MSRQRIIVPKRAVWLIMAGFVLKLAGCSQDRDSAPMVEGEMARNLSRDSMRAVDAATAEYMRRSPGVPVRVHDFERIGEDYLVTFYPGGDWVGAGAVIRVKRDGSTVVEREWQ